MKLSFSKQKPVFVVNAEKRVVTCIMKAQMNVEDESSDFLYRSLNRMVFKAVGIAKCHPDDTFSETKGKRVAESKAKRAAYLEGRRRFKKMAKSLAEYSKQVDQAINNLEAYAKKEEDHIKELGENS